MSTHTLSWSADEVFEMAEQMEREGAAFYRAAADAADDEELRKVLLELAAQEESHLRTFGEMRARLRDEFGTEEIYDPDGVVTAYLRQWVEGQVFDKSVSHKELLAKLKTPKDVIDMAIGLEKDSIAFYAGIRGFVPEKLGADWVDRIIEEEMKHIVVLTKEMRKYK